MSGKRYAEELKIEAVKQVTEGGYRLSEVAERLGVSSTTRSGPSRWITACTTTSAGCWACLRWWA